MDSKWKNFTQEELSCRGGCGRCSGTWKNMSPELMDKLQAIREEMGVPLKVTSAYRCPEYNAQISSTGLNGPHTTGRAIDIQVVGASAFVLVGLAMEKGILGIGVSQKGKHGKRFIHLDACEYGIGRPRPWIWSY